MPARACHWHASHGAGASGSDSESVTAWRQPASESAAATASGARRRRVTARAPVPVETVPSFRAGVPAVESLAWPLLLLLPLGTGSLTRSDPGR